MAIQTMTDGALELLELALNSPDAIRYHWSNAEAGHGVFLDTTDLELLLHRIGTTPEWDFICIRTEPDNGLWAQTCGRAATGLIVEINGPALVAHAAARRRPRTQIGTPTWPYLAATAETHNIHTAGQLLLGWITRGAIPTGYATRAPDLHVPRENYNLG